MSSGSDTAGWYPDPVGRHDFRYWNSTAWTEHVADGGASGTDPLEPTIAAPATIRPSWDVYASKLRGLAWWRWLVTALVAALFIPFAVVALYEAGGWLMVTAFGVFGAFSVFVLPLLYFNLMQISADARGVRIRNQLGFRRFVPRERIGAVAIGKAWSGGLRSADYAFITSPAAEQLGRFFLDLWDPADFGRIAGALGLALYGRPGRRLDWFHSGRNTERLARFYMRSWVAGAVVGCALPLVLLVAIIAVALLMAHR